MRRVMVMREMFQFGRFMTVPDYSLTLPSNREHALSRLTSISDSICT